MNVIHNEYANSGGLKRIRAAKDMTEKIYFCMPEKIHKQFE